MKNVYLDHDTSDASDQESGYDSEAAEISKTASSIPPSKRRKLSHSDRSDTNERDGVEDPVGTDSTSSVLARTKDDQEIRNQHSPIPSADELTKRDQIPQPKRKDHGFRKKQKLQTPGVIYLSSVPPYLQPSALRTLLYQRGFSPITRLFLAPSTFGKSSSRKRYAEGWIEFASKKTARRCAETLNAERVGGKKGNQYYDDIWNMKYLKGMAWDELMAGIRGEKREEEARRDEERRRLKKEITGYMESVEKGKMIDGIDRKRSVNQRSLDSKIDSGDKEVGNRTWRQFEVKRQGRDDGERHADGIGQDTKNVLGQIFG